MFYINQLHNPSFPIGLVKTESGFNVRSVENGSVSLHLFLVMWLFLRSLDVICYDSCILSEGHKSYFQGLVSHELTAYLSIFNLFKLNELWPYYQKHVNQMVLNL